MQNSLYQANRQQLLMMGSTIFISVTAAVIVSTLLIMTLMRGEVASALAANTQTSSPTSQVASTCAVPESEQEEDQAAPAAPDLTSSVTPVSETASAPLIPSYHYVKPATSSVNNSYNATNISNTTTTNNVTNTELHNKTTVIKDSFNKDSYNDNSKNSHNPVVVKDNNVTIDSNNTKNVNSGNTIDASKTVNIDNSTKTVDTTINSHSNNTTNSNNTLETHILSDNKVIVPIVPVVPVPTPVL